MPSTSSVTCINTGLVQSWSKHLCTDKGRRGWKGGGVCASLKVTQISLNSELTVKCFRRWRGSELYRPMASKAGKNYFVQAKNDGDLNVDCRICPRPSARSFNGKRLSSCLKQIKTLQTCQNKAILTKTKMSFFYALTGECIPSKQFLIPFDIDILSLADERLLIY